MNRHLPALCWALYITPQFFVAAFFIGDQHRQKQHPPQASNDGLLRGIDVTMDDNSHYYTSDLGVKHLDDIAWLQHGSARRAAQDDAKSLHCITTAPREYLKEIHYRMGKFQGSTLVYERQVEKAFLALHTTQHHSGQFCLVLGGKDVGKSLVLKDLVKRLNEEDGNHLALYISFRLGRVQ